MAPIGRPPIHLSPDERHDAQKGYRNKHWKHNSKRYNCRRRESYARKKEAAGASVRAYNRRPPAGKQEKKVAQRIERDVESPQARVRRTTELTLARARSTRNEMKLVLNGTPCEYFNQVCDDYIRCDDEKQGNEEIDRLCTRFNTFLTTINQFEDQILNAVGSWAPQMQEYQALKDEVRQTANMAQEIYEAALSRGKAEVLCQATEGTFAFQRTQ
ncbi:hypothetical protein BKA70DRAFT_1435106 [Coprinopsis sp. MPI-PUGE-AT-0042]|nr:hypothetical protein BKA70DRAFT_1435106 [Coprinopsis sp. MPI-PUGE-AT-0042]